MASVSNIPADRGHISHPRFCWFLWKLLTIFILADTESEVPPGELPALWSRCSLSGHGAIITQIGVIHQHWTHYQGNLNRPDTLVTDTLSGQLSPLHVPKVTLPWYLVFEHPADIWLSLQCVPTKCPYLDICFLPFECLSDIWLSLLYAPRECLYLVIWFSALSTSLIFGYHCYMYQVIAPYLDIWFSSSVCF